jgi:RND family efflux transporter MFP subunit
VEIVMGKTDLDTPCGMLVLGAVLFLASCGTTERAGDEPSEDQLVTVPVVGVAREAVTERLELAAEFRSYQEIDVRSRVSGSVDQIRVDIGDRVRQGQLIATLKAPESRSELDQATAARKRSEREVLRGQSEVERAQSELDAARLVYSRLAGVFESNPNLIARQEVDDALAKARVAEAQLDAAMASLAVAQESVRVLAANEATARTMADYTAITAPFSGLITARHADKGAVIQGSGGSQGLAIVQLSQVDPLRLVLAIPESVAPVIAVGRIVQVRVPTLKQAFDGRVARFSGKVDSETRTMETEVDVANPDLVLKPGMYAFAEIVLAREHSALTVPVQALSRQKEKTAAMIVNADNRLELRDVVTGIETPSRIEVVSGLSDGDLVVVGSHSQLEPGQRVRPKDVQPATVVNEEY